MNRYLSVALFAVSMGCAGTEQEQPASKLTTTAAVVTPDIPATPKPMPEQEAFTDDQILALVAVFNTDAIDLATAATDHAKDVRVRDFARRLAAEHGAARDQEAQLSERLALHPAPTDKMRALKLTGTADAQTLSALDGPAFDAAFVHTEAMRERDGLAMIDLQLIPSAKIPDMQAHLARLHDVVDHQLRDAEDIEEAMAPVASR